MSHEKSAAIALAVQLGEPVPRLPEPARYIPPAPLALAETARPPLIRLNAFEASATAKIPLGRDGVFPIAVPRRTEARLARHVRAARQVMLARHFRLARDAPQDPADRDQEDTSTRKPMAMNAMFMSTAP